MNNKIPFIFPSVYFGGHEIMTIEIIKLLNSESAKTVIAYVNEKNTPLINALADAKIAFEKYAGYESKWKPVTHIFNLHNARNVRDILCQASKLANGGKIFLAQGSIELGSDFLFWAWLLNINVVSYIPFAHSAFRLNRKWPYIRELIGKFYYKICSRYVTISNVFKEQLLTYNPKAKVSICRNFISSERINDDPFHVDNKRESTDFFNIFVVGRVVFSHKGQDLAVKAFSKYLQHHGIRSTKRLALHIVGDGPDLPALKEMVASMDVVSQEAIHFHGWSDAWWRLESLPDLLLIPSHFEGVPLVMLESIKLGIPVIASNVDGMLDYLNPDCLFYNDEEGIVLCLERVFSKNSSASKLNTFRCAVRQDVSSFIFN